MKLPFAVRLALREGRATARRLGVYMGAITLGVAALVAINGFRANAVATVESESKALLGADLRLRSTRPFPDSVQAVLDSAARAGDPVSTVISTASVALTPAGATRLVQLRAASGGYPYYGEFVSDPPGLWQGLEDDRRVLVEPEVLEALGAAIGDSVRLGEASFRIAGVLVGMPPEISFRSALAPRAYIGGRWMAETGLLQFGSLVRYEAYLRLAPDPAADAFIERYRDLLRRHSVGFDTAREESEDLAFALDALGRFLGLVGLAGLLLGGLGVASAVHVFISEKRSAIAVLRCVGATQRAAFLAYLLQATALGVLGALVGAALGLAVQPLLPAVLGDLLPLRVGGGLRWAPALAGIALGGWVAAVFALLPLLDIRGITPLQALRREVEPPARSRPDAPRLLAFAAIAGSIAALSVSQAGELLPGLAFAGGLMATLLVLALTARLLSRATRRWFPRRAPYPVRQGIASLYRPHSQTTAVTVAVGFGVFLIATLWLVQRSLLARFDVSASADGPNLVAFDIQPDQRVDLAAAFRARGLEPPPLVPIVTARIAALNGTPAAEFLEPPRVRDIEPWAVRREYRNTYRDTLTATEQLVAGSWWPREPGRERAADALPRISIEEDVASSLDVGIGDRITWDVQGVEIETRVASVRRVDWAQFETNFFVVFEPGVLENAPQSFVTLARVPDPADRAALQRDLVRAHPNVSFIDLTLVQQTIARIVRSASAAVRFMAIFAVGGGLVVLAGAVSASRFQRMRETVLLRTIGATRAQVRRMLLTEYLALGTLAGLAGATLAVAAAWGLARFFFEMPFRFDAPPLIAAWALAAGLAVGIGLLGSRSVLRRTPLAVLREVAE